MDEADRVGNHAPSYFEGAEIDTELAAWDWLGGKGRYSEDDVTDVLRLSLVTLRQARALVAQQRLSEGLLGDPDDGGVPADHPARTALTRPAYCPATSRKDAPDLVLATEAEGAVPLEARLVVEHKPAGTPAHFSRGLHLWPDGDLFEDDPLAARYRDMNHVREWVFGLDAGEPISPSCMTAHGPHPTDPDRCEHGVRMRRPGAEGEARRMLHDTRDGPDRLYMSVPQVDVYRCSRGWVDRHASRDATTAFRLDDPSEVAWVVLSGNDPAWSVERAWGGWAYTEPAWSVTRYGWLAGYVSQAYDDAWQLAGRPRPEALPDHLQWLRMLGSMLTDRRRQPEADG